MTVENPGYAKSRAELILDNAASQEPNASSPPAPVYAMYNLNKAGSLPVYFTELLAEALGLDEGEA